MKYVISCLISICKRATSIHVHNMYFLFRVLMATIYFHGKKLLVTGIECSCDDNRLPNTCIASKPLESQDHTGSTNIANAHMEDHNMMVTGALYNIRIILVIYYYYYYVIISVARFCFHIGFKYVILHNSLRNTFWTGPSASSNSHT